MATGDHTQAAPLLRNDFEPITRDKVETNLILAMDQVEQLRTIFATIARLEPEGEVCELARMGKSIAIGLHNDIDVMREEAEKAGLVVELVPEKRPN